MTDTFDYIVVGGGSSVNAMIYVRGQAEDYDAWAQMGLKGWSYSHLKRHRFQQI